MRAFQGLFLLLLASGVLSQKEYPETQAVAQSNNEFTTSFYQALRARDSGNLLFSPFSLSSAMAMVKVGARGQTATEIQRGMRYPADDKALLTGFRSLLSTLKSNENFTLETANRVYLQKGFSLNPEYSQTLRDYFKADAQQVNFAESSSAASQINGWVEDVTRNKIKDLFSADSFDSFTRLVLVNAIYFKGLWANKFDPEFTRQAPFYVSPTENVTVDMMKSESDYPYADIQDLDAKAVALPYKGDRLSMIILLPNQKDGLPALEKKLETYNLASIPAQMRSRKVSLSLPRFKLECEIDLTDILTDLGMSSMFQDNADFKGISTEYPLKVSKGIHKAFIEVNEEGSEAAAATGFQLTLKSAFWGPLMKVEHPFVAYIVDNSTSAVLFMTSVVNPTNETVTVASARSLTIPHMNETMNGGSAATIRGPSSMMSFIPMLIVSSFVFLRHILITFL